MSDILYVLIAIYMLGALFLAGVLTGYDMAESVDYFIPVVWPVWLAWMLVWGKRGHRRWWCWLAGHDDRPCVCAVRTTTGEKKCGYQCDRCWRTRDVRWRLRAEWERMRQEAGDDE